MPSFSIDVNRALELVLRQLELVLEQALGDLLATSDEERSVLLAAHVLGEGHARPHLA